MQVTYKLSCYYTGLDNAGAHHRDVMEPYSLWILVTALCATLGLDDSTMCYFGLWWWHYVMLWERLEFADAVKPKVVMTSTRNSQNQLAPCLAIERSPGWQTSDLFARLAGIWWNKDALAWTTTDLFWAVIARSRCKVAGQTVGANVSW